MAVIDAGLVRGPQGPQGIKGDPFTYADFTESQIAELQRPATEAAVRADKATEDAQTAIAEVKATEAKLYPAAENVLKGKVKETFVHVDDAFPSSLLTIEIEGACRQDGTPSPDNPVPIEVIEHPVVRVTGANLLDIHEGMSKSDCNKKFGSDTKRIIKPGTCVVGLTSNNYLSANNLLNVKIGNGAVSFHSDAGGYGVGFGVSLVPGVTYKFGAKGNPEFRFAFYSADGTWLSHVSTSRPTVPINAVYSVLVITNTGNSQDVELRDIYGASTQITYEPYVGTSQAFTLPTEHSYIAKLPDGTADEIVVDSEGNVELVARVGKAVNAKILSSGSAGELDNTNGVSIYGTILDDVHKVALTGIPKEEGAAYCDKLYSAKYRDENVTNAVFKPLSDVFVVNIAGAIDEQDAKEKFDALESVVYAPIVEKHYQLGKIEMPKAQDSIVNAWTDAEVTPRTGIEYTRDVNIVVSNLESAIASIS